MSADERPIWIMYSPGSTRHPAARVVDSAIMFANGSRVLSAARSPEPRSQ